MAPSESASRPTYVYLLALTALLLFGVNFASFVGSASCESERHVVVQHGHADAFEFHVVAPPLPALPHAAELGAELERARHEVARARKHVEAARAHAPRAAYVYVR